MSKSLSRAVIVLLVAPLIALGACANKSKPAPGTTGQPVSAASSESSSSESEAPATGATLDVIAAEPASNTFVFDTAGVTNLPAGIVNVTFTNSTPEKAHELRIVRIRDGNFHAYENAVRSQGEAASAGLADEIANTSVQQPGSDATLTVTLTPGVYALVSFAPAEGGKVDAQLGMVRQLDITPV
jgi:hypothetical protein